MNKQNENTNNLTANKIHDKFSGIYTAGIQPYINNTVPNDTQKEHPRNLYPDADLFFLTQTNYPQLYSIQNHRSLLKSNPLLAANIAILFV